MNRNLFLAISIPDDMPGDDPDDVADQVVAILNDSRRIRAWAKAIFAGNGDVDPDVVWATVERIMVNAIPAPQWLTAETFEHLRRSAQ